MAQHEQRRRDVRNPVPWILFEPSGRASIFWAEWTDVVSQMYAHIKTTLERRGARIEDVDAAIAAHALALGATLVTANLGHMRRIPGLHVEDWSR